MAQVELEPDGLMVPEEALLEAVAMIEQAGPNGPCIGGHIWERASALDDVCTKCGHTRTWIVRGPTVDISNEGESPCLQSANRQARRAAMAHARKTQ